MSDEDLLTTQEAAAELGVTDSRVRQLIIDGKLPAQRFGRSHMIKRGDLKGVVIGNRGRPRKNSNPIKYSERIEEVIPKRGKA
jgi:excisionase family DNA binding protein